MTQGEGAPRLGVGCASALEGLQAKHHHSRQQRQVAEALHSAQQPRGAGGQAAAGLHLWMRTREGGRVLTSTLASKGLRLEPLAAGWGLRMPAELRQVLAPPCAAWRSSAQPSPTAAGAQAAHGARTLVAMDQPTMPRTTR